MLNTSMEDEEYGRGKRLRRVIECRNGLHICGLSAFQNRSSSCSVLVSKSSSKVVQETQFIVRASKEPESTKTRKKRAINAEEVELRKDTHDNTLCEECAQGDAEQDMLLCDRCDRGYHMFCLCPILPTVPLGDWFCPKCSQSSHVEEFPKVQKKIVDFFRIHKPAPFTTEVKYLETRKRRRPSGSIFSRSKKSRRLLPYVPCTDPQRRLEQMASLATALTSIGVEFTDSLSYGMAPRSANRADNEKGGMQTMGKEDQATLGLCKTMCSHGEWPPLMVTHDSRQGFLVEADRNIKDMTIIAEYTGDVDYMCRRQYDSGNSIMGLLFSDDPAMELVICPDRRGNIARFVSGINNHSLASKSTKLEVFMCTAFKTLCQEKLFSVEGRKKQNVRCVRYNIDGEARVILVAVRDIPKGERLYYDYNAFQTEYPTQHFV